MTKWTDYVKKYAKDNGLTYREAVKEAGPSYKKRKAKEKKKEREAKKTTKKAKKEPKKKPKKKKEDIPEEDKEPFCGIGKVPGKYRRGTAQECLDKNQIRYYGVEAIDLNKMTKTNKKIPTFDELNQQRLFLKFEATKLVRLIKNNKLLMELGTDAEKKFAADKQKKYNKDRDNLLKRIQENQKQIDDLPKN